MARWRGDVSFTMGLFLSNQDGCDVGLFGNGLGGFLVRPRHLGTVRSGYDQERLLEALGYQTTADTRPPSPDLTLRGPANPHLKLSRNKTRVLEYRACLSFSPAAECLR